MLFLCPTKQLCHQVDSQAHKYGIATSLLVGRQQDYDVDQFYKYQQAKSIAITTYSGVFNTHPKIDDPELIICDDAYAADNYIVSMWTVSVKKREHPDLFRALFQEIKPAIPDNIAYLIDNNNDDPVNRQTVDLVSAISAYDYFDQLRAIFDQYGSDKDLVYSWNTIASHLDACSIYCSIDSIEIRPIIPLTLTHPPFAKANQRVYMSATLGEDGGLERAFGIAKIDRLPIPEGWDKRGTGRRLVLFPSLSGQEDKNKELETTVALLEQEKINRALILVPDNTTKESIKEKLPKSYKILDSTNVEQSINAFVKDPGPVILIVANRYDGIDLPGDDCHLMIIYGLPSAVGLHEKYILRRLGAISLLRDRIRTRVTQALGRCTRDESDYSVVLLLGSDLVKWFCTKTNTQGMHPELQSEIDFGLDNSTDRPIDEMVELCGTFLSRTDEWEDAEHAIQDKRNSLTKTNDSVATTLQKITGTEIEYIYKSWSGQHEKAMNLAAEIASGLEGGSDLNPYRAFWHHQTAVSAFLAWKTSGKDAFKRSALAYLDIASSASLGINWLVKVRFHLTNELNTEVTEQVPFREWFQAIYELLEEWSIISSRFLKRINNGKVLVQGQKAALFEQGLEILGKMLGARTYKWNDNGAPDGLWIFGDWCAFVFEAKTEEKKEGGVSLADVRQAGTHEQRVRAEKLIPSFVPCFTVMISPKEGIHNTAVIHTGHMTYVSQEEIVKLFIVTSRALENVRNHARGNTEETLRMMADQIYSDNHVSMVDVKNLLLKKRLSDMPVVD